MPLNRAELASTQPIITKHPQPASKVTVSQNINWLNKIHVIAGISAIILGVTALYCYKSGYFSNRITVVGPKSIDPSVPAALGISVVAVVSSYVCTCYYLIFDLISSLPRP